MTGGPVPAPRTPCPWPRIDPQRRAAPRPDRRDLPLLRERDATVAGRRRPISPHRLRHVLLTWLKRRGLDDARIQPSSGHASRQSLERSSRLALGEAQAEYDRAIGRFPV